MLAKIFGLCQTLALNTFACDLDELKKKKKKKGAGEGEK